MQAGNVHLSTELLLHHPESMRVPVWRLTELCGDLPSHQVSCQSVPQLKTSVVCRVAPLAQRPAPPWLKLPVLESSEVLAIVRGGRGGVQEHGITSGADTNRI